MSKMTDSRYLSGVSELDDDVSEAEWLDTYSQDDLVDEEPEAFRAVPRPFTAAHSGRCVSCPDTFSEGELIIHAVGGWAHETCPNDKPTGAVCQTCHTAAALSGECLC